MNFRSPFLLFVHFFFQHCIYFLHHNHLSPNTIPYIPLYNFENTLQIAEQKLIFTPTFA